MGIKFLKKFKDLCPIPFPDIRVKLVFKTYIILLPFIEILFAVKNFVTDLPNLSNK